MNTPVIVVIASHLSDVQEMTNVGRTITISLNHGINRRLNFAKWLLVKYGNAHLEIDPDADWEKFLEEEKERTTKSTTRKEAVKYIMLGDSEILKKGDQFILKTDLVNGKFLWKDEHTSFGQKISHYPEHIFRRPVPEPKDMAFTIRGEPVKVYPGEKITIGCQTIEARQVKEMASAFFSDALLLGS